ncbi:GAF domain-containing protein [bacterium]|nr:GAF domain-containing protein [bacterium]MBU1984577.1 GAF domain-containing protein [bacterium]
MNDMNRFLPRVSGSTLAERCQSVCEQLRAWNPRYEWVGIYWVNGDFLVLKSWSGKQATHHVKIPISHGICGAAVREDRTVIVDDVSLDPRYLSCFPSTKSEIVVPIQQDGRAIGEIDIDSSMTSAFGDGDRVLLEALAQHISQWSAEFA